RLALAKILFDAPNLLVLDEPTNHLDLVTKRALVKSLALYEGTIVFVSHDRAFLRAIATRILELSRDGKTHVYGGSYDEYVAATGREAPGMRQATWRSGEPRAASSRILMRLMRSCGSTGFAKNSSQPARHAR